MKNTSNNWFVRSESKCSSEQDVKILFPRVVVSDKYLNPLLLMDLREAMRLIYLYNQQKKKIRLIGDFDCDGVIAIIISLLGFKKAGIEVDYKLLKKENGYGLCNNDVDEAIADDISLIITVDNGISCHSSIEYAKKNGLEVIVTDHHNVSKKKVNEESDELQDNLPNCLVINPKRSDCHYPNKDLCGAGVAFKLMQAFLGVEKSMFLTPLVAIASIADLVSVLGENRKIIIDGITLIQQKSDSIPIGLTNLLTTLGLDFVDEEVISRVIGPVLNAPGRLGDASIVIKVLLGEESPNALIELNESRKKVTFENVELLEENLVLSKNMALAKDCYYDGILGILAGRLKERYSKFTVIIHDSGEQILKGSVRSDYINVYDTLSKFKKYLLKFGGHDNAGGFLLKIDDYDSFINDLTAYVDSLEISVMKSPSVFIPSNAISISLIQYVDSLKPFGIGYPKLLFSTTLNVRKAIPMGDDVKFIDVNIQGIARNQLKKYESLGSPDVINVVGELTLNEFMGKITPQLQIIDFWK